VLDVSVLLISIILFAREELCGERAELSECSLPGSQERGDGLTRGRGDLVAVGAGDLLQQTVCSKEPEFTADGGRTPPLFFRRLSRSREQERLQVPVAQAVDGEFASVDCFQQRDILGGPETQSAHPFPISGRGLGQAVG